MTVAEMRIELAKYYGKQSLFANTVNMRSDRQILAVYFRLKREGKIK